MKDAITVTKQQLDEMMQYFNNIFDVVRLVEPEATEVVRFNGDKIMLSQPEPCFAVWEKNGRCENCISMRACTERRRITKFEFRNEEIYSVIAMPVIFETKGKQHCFSVELVNHVTDDLEFQSYGSGDITDKVAVLNQKIYCDSLTGVYNRRYYDEHRYIYEMTSMLPHRLCFLVADINHFKSINDTYGHAFGDKVLIAVAEAFQNSVRQTDKVIRFGGDEFLVVLRDCDIDFVERKIIALKQAINEIDVSEKGCEQLEVAIGMAYTDKFNGSPEQIETLIKEADSNMYIDKDAVGANR